MAEQSTHDVVDQALSVGDHSPSDAPATKPNYQVTQGEREEDAHAIRIETSGQTRSKHHTIEETGITVADEQVTNGLTSNTGSVNGDQHSPNPTPVSTFSETVNLGGDVSGPDTAGGSDTDTSRAEGSAAEDGRGQEQSYSVKRPASFKPVSFPKFSVAKGPGANSTVKVNADKAATNSNNSSTSSLQQGPRPRLVAKTTSGLRESAPKALRSAGRNGTAGPDPMQVWNKNRPAPPPSTKHLTDEELKQQYGIHMTSRIQGDGEGKEAKWADIDDDEDDWAPETIEWNDGTKVTLNHTDSMALGPDAKQEPLLADRGKPVQPPKAPPQVVSSVGPNATILKLGANAERQQAQKAATLQKVPSEKTSQLSSKAPAPAPTKSPWAALPPVDRVSPIAINPQMAMPAPARFPFPNQANVQSPSSINAPSPAKEMSADDFNRSWREPLTGQPRELYMPNSGRYETVNEGRRRGSRNDQQFRAPALLQRPNHNDQQAPAEPSAAFQTNRSSTDQERGAWTRRRASSNISGGSGQFGRRMSLTKPGDILTSLGDVIQPRPGSQAARSESIDSPREGPPPQLQNQSYQARGPSPAYGATRQASSHPDLLPQNATLQTGQDNLEAEKARQKVLMREKRELAIKRRQEEEERLESEKRERIRLKLEAMGPPPPTDAKVKTQEQPAGKAPALVDIPHTVQSPPKPPIPEATGEPKQYGMMKVHHPDTVKKFNTTPIDKQPEAPAQIVDGRSASQNTSEPRSEAPKLSATVVNGLPQSSVSPASQQRHSSQENLAANDSAQPVKGNTGGSEARTGWGSSRADLRAPAPASLWGPPTNNKALGNGTFDQSIAGFPSLDTPSRNHPSYPPQGWMNGRPPPTDKSPQSPYLAHEVGVDKPLAVPSFPSPDQQPLAVNSEVDSLYPASKPTPIAPPQQTQAVGPRWQPSPTMRSNNNGVAAWNNFHTIAAKEDRAESERHQRELATRLEEEARTGIRRTPQYTFEETWKQVEVGDQAGQRQIMGVAKSSVNPQLPTIQPFGAVGSLPGADAGTRTMNGMPVRGSRFFPPGIDNLATQNRRAVTYGHPDVPRSPSPPPAEEYASNHPAYAGDVKRPVVSFPAPKVVVKLPPPAASPPPKAPLSFAAAAASQPAPSLRVFSTPIAATPSWQDRFNGLLGKKTSPEKKQVLAVTSSTREPLDVLLGKVSASVSLPQKDDLAMKDAGKVTSKDVEDEEEIFEDREAGSLPLVKIPQKAPPAAWQPSPSPQIRPNSRLYKPEDPFSAQPLILNFLEEQPRNGNKDVFILVHLPGSKISTKMTMPRKGASTTLPSKGPRNNSASFNNSSSSNKNRKGAPKSRESSATYPQSLQSGKGNPALPPTPNGNILSARSHNNGWRGSHAPSTVSH